MNVHEMLQTLCADCATIRHRDGDRVSSQRHCCQGKATTPERMGGHHFPRVANATVPPGMCTDVLETIQHGFGLVA